MAAGRERTAVERFADTVRDELNVKQVRFVAGAEELGRYEVKANYRKLGPLFGPEMPLVAKAIAALDPDEVAAAVTGGERAAGERPTDGRTANTPHGTAGIGISVAGREHTLGPEDVILTMKAPEGYSVEREGAHAVALDLEIDEGLLREGRAREIVRAVQNARKSAGLHVEDRIELALKGDPDLIAAAEEHREYIVGETLAVSLAFDGGAGVPTDHIEQAEIEEKKLEVALRRSR